MVFARFLRSSNLRAPLPRRLPAIGGAAPLRFSSSIAELSVPPGPKPRTLSSIFAKPASSTAPPKPRTLSSIFAEPIAAQKPKTSSAPVKEKTRSQSRRPSRPRLRPRPVGEGDPPKPPLPEAAILVRRLEEGGYLKGDILSQGTAQQTLAAELDSRHFVQCAAEKFGQEHQEIAKSVYRNHDGWICRTWCDETIAMSPQWVCFGVISRVVVWKRLKKGCSVRLSLCGEQNSVCSQKVTCILQD